jgi:hypothetical protein
MHAGLMAGASGFGRRKKTMLDVLYWLFVGLGVAGIGAAIFIIYAYAKWMSGGSH